MKVAIARSPDGHYRLLETLLKGPGITHVDMEPNEYKELLWIQTQGDTAQGRLILLWQKGMRL